MRNKRIYGLRARDHKNTKVIKPSRPNDLFTESENKNFWFVRDCKYYNKKYNVCMNDSSFGSCIGNFTYCDRLTNTETNPFNTINNNDILNNEVVIDG